MNGCDSFILAELAGLVQLTPKSGEKTFHAVAVTETRGKTRHTIALKVSRCRSSLFYPSGLKHSLKSKIIDGNGERLRDDEKNN